MLGQRTFRYLSLISDNENKSNELILMKEEREKIIIYKQAAKIFFAHLSAAS